MRPLISLQRATVTKHTDRDRFGLRARTSIVFMGAVLLTIIAISGLTITTLKGQRAMLENAIRDSQSKATALLANRIEQVMLAAMRPPFLALENMPPNTLDKQQLQRLLVTYPVVSQILFLDVNMKLRGSFPPPQNEQQRHLLQWLGQRAALEGANTDTDRFALHTYTETIGGQPALFGLEQTGEMDRATGWILILFNLDAMQSTLLEPMLQEFRTEQGGSVELLNPEADWDDDALNWPIGRVLPGWMLAFKPPPTNEEQRVRHESTLALSITAGLILTIVMATFAAWRELRREHALIELRNRFVANVSHELKTPLSLIRMYAETLYLRRIKNEERQHDYHRVLLREAERLSQMINTVLDFSRLSHGEVLYHLTDTDLRDTILDVLEKYRWRIEDQGLTLETHIDTTIPPVAHDRAGVTQMLLNLIDNAVKYAVAGKRVAVYLTRDADRVSLAVIDEGPGIPVEERARLLKPFERGEGIDPATGSGLGLALVDQLARVHHAQFSLDNSPRGNGLQATLRFPLTIKQS